jgi:hypothetical protein
MASEYKTVSSILESVRAQYGDAYLGDYWGSGCWGDYESGTELHCFVYDRECEYGIRVLQYDCCFPHSRGPQDVFYPVKRNLTFGQWVKHHPGSSITAVSRDAQEIFDTACAMIVSVEEGHELMKREAELDEQTSGCKNETFYRRDAKPPVEFRFLGGVRDMSV